MFKMMVFVIVLSCAFMTNSQAQNYGTPNYYKAPNQIGFGPSYGYGGFAYRHSSTVQEGWQRGRADLYRGYGDYLRNRAIAAYIYEQARQQRVDSWRHYVETRQSLKDQYKARQAARTAKIRERNLNR